MVNDDGQRVLFKIIPVKLHGNNDVIIETLTDEGSSVTIMNKGLADRLQLSGPKRNLNMQWFGDHSSNEESFVVNCKISGVHKSAKLFDINNVCTVKSLCLPMQSLDLKKLHTL